MTKNLDTAKAKLTIVSNTISPEEISRRIGLSWDDARRIGDPKGRSGQTWGDNIWWLYETSEGQEDGRPVELRLDECLGRLRERISSAAEAIRILSRTETVELGLYVLAQVVPPIHMTTATLDFIQGLGAELDVDVVLYEQD